ncbi:MAG: hypothetical protein KH282_08115 [Clostridiales bacterium]|nr:hypothetical protein [Clostridiales bacterium]
MTKEKFSLQRFAAETGATTTADLAPEISIDFTSRLNDNITEFQRLLGINEMMAMPEGAVIKIYKTTVASLAAQVGEGEDITATKVSRALAQTIAMTLKKYRRVTTAEAIQKFGRTIAINDCDDKLVAAIQKDIKKDFYTTLATGTGTGTAGANLQQACANAWAKLQEVFEDTDATPVFFIHPTDAANYLGSAGVTVQTAFGMSYLQNFLGIGNAVISPQLTAGTVIATASENLNGAYVPASGSDLAQTFGLTSDATGMVGMTHNAKTGNATVETLILSCVKFFPEVLDKVVKVSISAE